MNKWFSETFLPSVFDRAGTDKSMWLSRKQTSICVDNMEKHTVMQAQFQGDYTRHNYYTAEWNGRKIDLQYSKLNGCGTITFSMTKEEAEESRKAYQAEREAEKIERRENLKANKPERIAMHVEKESAKVDHIKEEIADLYKELSNTDDKELVEDINDDISFAEQRLNEAQKELNFWVA